MPNHTVMLTIPEYLANQVSQEFSRLKRSRAVGIDFSQLMTRTINLNGIHDAESVSRMRSEISKVFAERRKQRGAGQLKLTLRPKKKYSEADTILSEMRMEKMLQSCLESAQSANEDTNPLD